jgi:hypothetical protein
MTAFFNINWQQLIQEQLPIRKRKAGFIAWLNCLIQPVLTLYNIFMAFRQSSLYKVSHNSQVVYLQKLLNDKFDPVLRRIKITNAVIVEPVWFYEAEEARPVWFYEPEDNLPVHFKEQTEFVGDGIDFNVIVPAQLQPQSQQQLNALLSLMKAEIDYYKLYSKNYNIAWIE